MVRPKLQKYKEYYDGNQEIMKKQGADPALNKPCNRIVTNFCKNIVDNFQGYLTGIDITYTSDDDIEDIQNILNYNDVSYEDSELLKQALIYGVAYEICYIDEDGQQRFNLIDSRDAFPIYYNTLTQELAGFVYYWLIDNTDATKGYYVDVYDATGKSSYKAQSMFSSLVLLEQNQYFYNQIPVSVFSLNREEVSVFDCVLTLQDAYNTLTSSEVDDFQAFCDAYLVLKGLHINEDEAYKIRTHRILDLGDGNSTAEAYYLTKNIADTQIENMLENIRNNIHKISCCPDFSDTAFGTASGIAMKYKLLGFENRSGAIEKQMVKALQKRVELICSILRLTNTELETWRDVQIIFTRNMPTDYSELITTVNGLRGLVSDKTLLSQLPFIQDIDAEMDAIQEQKEQNMELYNFGNNTEDDDDVLGEESR